MHSFIVVLDQVASLRHIMTSAIPDPVAAGIIAQLAGADGVAVHMREDRKLIKEHDLSLLRKTIHSKFIMHMAPRSEMVAIALDIRPERVILVPPIEEAAQVEKGLDLIIQSKSLFETVDALHSNDISVGICIPADPKQSKIAHQIHADWVQIHAGKLSAASSPQSQSRELGKIIDTVKMAQKLRLRISIGCGLNDQLIKLFKGVSEIDEFMMGRSLVAKAILMGMEKAINQTIDVIRTL